MTRESNVLANAQTLLDYTSADGPRVTHVRGTLIAGSRKGLRELGVYDQYVELLPEPYRDVLLYCVANSWLPMEETMVHFEACDRICLTQPSFDRIGEALAEQLRQTFLAAALRTTRSLGADAAAFPVLRKFDRLLGRVYRGGRALVRRDGPKDAVIELRGIRFARSTYYRGVLATQTRVMMNLFCRTTFVRFTRPQSNDGESIALSISWV